MTERRRTPCYSDTFFSQRVIVVRSDIRPTTTSNPKLSDGRSAIETGPHYYFLTSFSTASAKAKTYPLEGFLKLKSKSSSTNFTYLPGTANSCLSSKSRSIGIRWHRHRGGRQLQCAAEERDGEFAEAAYDGSPNLLSLADVGETLP